MQSIRTRTSLSLLLGLGFASLVASDEGALPGRSDREVMLEFSTGFRELGAALEGEGSTSVTEAVAAMRSAGRHLLEERPERGQSYTAQAERVDGLLQEIDALAAEGRGDAAHQAYGDLRSACVICHAQDRTDEEGRGDYPLLGNLVTGKVDLLDADGEPLEDRSWVLVFLERKDSQAIPAPPRNPAILSQTERRFEPRVLPVVRGTTVEFPNDDTIFHNVFSLSKIAPFDLGTYKPGNSRSVEMTRPGLVKVYCNIHPEMRASIVVLAEPWFTLTGPDGSFVLPNVPDGLYVLRAWNDMGAETQIPVDLTGGSARGLRLQMRNELRVLRHKNKYGQGYGDKYR